MDYENVLSIVRDIRSKLDNLRNEADERKAPVQSTSRSENERENRFSRVKVVSPKEDMQRSENMTAKALDDFTVESIAARYQKNWCKLDSRMKRDRLAIFAKTFEGNEDAESFLIQHYFETKKIRPKDIEYDEIRGKVVGIPAMVVQDGVLAIKRPKVVKDKNAADSKSVDRVAKTISTKSTLSKKLNARRV